MLDEAAKINIDSLTIEALGENIALSYYGAMDSNKSRYAQHVLEMKKRKENDDRSLALIGAIGVSGEKLALLINKLTDMLDEQVDKMMSSNEKLANSQGFLLLMQVVMAGVLAFATIGLIVVTWIK